MEKPNKGRSLPPLVPQKFRKLNRGLGGWLVPFAMVLRLTAACPVSCVVCAQDVTLCHQLNYIVAAPETTRVLIITDGHLSSIESTNLSLLLNVALLSLSRNAIEVVQEDALHGLVGLRTLSLDHNRITSSALPDHTFSRLQALKVLVLSSNALGTLRGAWFRNTRALTRLLLDGNRITNLTRSSFGRTTLHRLRHLDLSNNLISYIENDAFRLLPQLQEVDLSRNRLAHMPDVFTPLKQLSLLSLDQNQWSCTCDLHPLALFLRTYTMSSAHALRNANDLNCQVSMRGVVAAKSMLRLSETNCDAKVPNLTVVLKDGRRLLPGQDVALMTILGFAGAVGLTYMGLAVFKWKLQQGKANEDTSGNLCCRTFDESLCAHEARNYHAMGSCNCHLPQENEIKVTSIVESRKEKPLLQENSHQAALASESTALDRSFRNLLGKHYGTDSTFSCLEGGLLQTGCSSAPGNRAAFNDARLVTGHCPKRAEKLRKLELGDSQSQTVPQQITRTIDISSGTFGGGCAASHSALAREGLGKHLTNESWQLPIGNGDNGLQPHRQRRFVTSSSRQPREPEGHCVEKILHKHPSKYDDSHGLLKWSTPMSSQPNTSLICKYVSCDQLQNHMKERMPRRRGHVKSDREKIQIYRAIEKFLMRDDNRDLWRLSEKPKKPHSTKRVSFHDPDSVGKRRLLASPRASTHRKEPEDQRSHRTTLDLQKWSSSEDTERRTWIIEPQKKKRHGQYDLKGKTKKQNLRIKLNLHPIRKTRVHPENSMPELLTKYKQMPSSPKKLARPSEPVSPAICPQQSERKSSIEFTCTELPLKYALEQTSYHKSTGAQPLSAYHCSLGKPVSVQGHCYISGQVPNGNSSTLPQPTPWDAEHLDSHRQCSTEQMENAPQLGLEVPSSFPASWGSTEDGGIPSPHSRLVACTATECMQYTGRSKVKTKELNQLSLSLRNQTQLLAVHMNDTFGKDHTSDHHEATQPEDQSPSHGQLGMEDRTSVEKSRAPPQTLASCVVDKERNEPGKELPNTETYDSSSIPWTQSKNSLAFMMTNSTVHQNRTEPPREISTSLGTQGIWHQISGSGRGTRSLDALSRHQGPKAIRIGTGEKEEKNATDERKPNSSVLFTERQQPWEDSDKEKHTVLDSSPVEETISANQSSITQSLGPKNSMQHRETELHVNSHIQNLQEAEESPAHRDGATADKMQGALPSCRS